MTASTSNNSKLLLTGTSNAGIFTVHSYFPRVNNFSLLHQISESAPAPSWLRVSRDKKKLFAVTAGTEEHGGGIDVYKLNNLTTLKTQGLSSLGVKVGSVASGWEPVSLDDAGRVLVSAAYCGHEIDTYLLQDEAPYISGPKQTITYTIPAPGPNAERQESSHPHQVLIDPTGSFLLVPDLGADLIRIYLIDQESATLIPVVIPSDAGSQPGTTGHVRAKDSLPGVQNAGDLKVPPGLGPRHGIFYTQPGKKSKEPDFYFLVGELSNEVVVYQTIYHSSSGSGHKLAYDWLELKQLQIISLYTPFDKTTPKNATAAEIAISYDTNTVFVSNRGDQTFPELKSDSISTFSVNINLDFNKAGGEVEVLSPKNIYPSGGRGPRHFDLAKLALGEGETEEEYITVANEGCGQVVVWRVEGWKEVKRISAQEPDGVGEGPAWVGWL